LIDEHHHLVDTLRWDIDDSIITRISDVTHDIMQMKHWKCDFNDVSIKSDKIVSKNEIKRDKLSAIYSYNQRKYGNIAIT
jgi:hypothetical protein